MIPLTSRSVDGWLEADAFHRIVGLRWRRQEQVRRQVHALASATAWQGRRRRVLPVRPWDGWWMCEVPAHEIPNHSFWVNVLGVTHTPADGVARPRLSFGSGRNTSYIVDTGTTGIYLPREVVSSIMSDLKLSWRPGAFPSIPCSRARENGTLAFEFLDKWEAIKVPYSTLVLENTPGSCLFLITSVESEAIDLHILGLGFLRAAYSESFPLLVHMSIVDVKLTANSRVRLGQQGRLPCTASRLREWDRYCRHTCRCWCCFGHRRELPVK